MCVRCVVLCMYIHISYIIRTVTQPALQGSMYNGRILNHSTRRPCFLSGVRNCCLFAVWFACAWWLPVACNKLVATSHTLRTWYVHICIRGCIAAHPQHDHAVLFRFKKSAQQSTGDSSKKSSSDGMTGRPFNFNFKLCRCHSLLNLKKEKN